MQQQADEGAPGGSGALWVYGLILAAFLALEPVSLPFPYQIAERVGFFVIAWLAAFVLCLFRPGDHGPVASSHYGYQRRTLVIGLSVSVVTALVVLVLGVFFLGTLNWAHVHIRPEPPGEDYTSLIILALLLAAACFWPAAMAFVLIRTLFGLVRLVQHRPVAAGRQVVLAHP